MPRNRLGRRLAATVAVVALTVATLLVADGGAYAGAAPAASVARVATATTLYNIVARHSNLCLGVSGGSADDGALIVQTSCAPSWSILWWLEYLGMGHYKVHQANTGKCLDVDLVSGSLADQNPCEAWSSQSWLIGRQPNNQDTWWDYRVTSTLCLDVFWASQANNAAVGVSTCWGGSNQTFKLVPAGPPPN